jgi:ABC-type transport system involved in multi-copper enzyme maturation permease subunit
MTSLIGIELLKLRKRRGLMAIALLLGVGLVTVVFTVNAVRHGVDPQHVGPAGGIKSFEDVTDFLGTLAVVIASIIGVTAGAGDAELGVLRDALATGRSRLALFGSRAAAATVVTLAIMAVGLVVVTAFSIVFAGSNHVPGLSEIVQRDGAVLGFAAASALVCTGVTTFARTRGPVMASLIAFGLVISELLLRVGFLGSARDVLPLAAFKRMVGDATTGLHMSLAVAIVVAIAWAAAALAAGGWWARRVEV